MLFDGYELLGLSGVGPGRLELRETGLASLGPYWIVLIPVALVILATLFKGLQEAARQIGSRGEFLFICALGLLPLAIVIFSGFAMHWRVLGRHMIAEIPLLSLLLALGLAKLFEKGTNRRWTFQSMIAMACLLALAYSSCSLRFADRHRKDDYKAVAAIALQENANGKRVWWAADSLGARYYGLPGEFDYMAELTGISKPYGCIDQRGVQAISAASGECLEKLSSPDVVIFSKPETFDKTGVIAAYLAAGNYKIVQTLPAFTVWKASRHQ